jgi:MtN3 and saliva related transmembrane protein
VSLIELMGLTASIMTTINSLPQIIKIIKTKSVDDISLTAIIILVVGLGLWTWYGVLISNIPIMISSGVQFILEIIIFGLVINHRRH